MFPKSGDHASNMVFRMDRAGRHGICSEGGASSFAADKNNQWMLVDGGRFGGKERGCSGITLVSTVITARTSATELPRKMGI
jgi:hypothetical protein